MTDLFFICLKTPHNQVVCKSKIIIPFSLAPDGMAALQDPLCAFLCNIALNASFGHGISVEIFCLTEM